MEFYGSDLIVQTRMNKKVMLPQTFEVKVCLTSAQAKVLS